MKTSKKALTLIELITIIIMLAVLATITVVSLQTYSNIDNTNTIEQDNNTEVENEDDLITEQDEVQVENEDEATDNSEEMTTEELELKSVFEKVSQADSEGNLALNDAVSGETYIFDTANYKIYRGMIDAEIMGTSQNYFYNLISHKNTEDGFICLEVSDTIYSDVKPIEGIHIDNCSTDIQEIEELNTYLY